MAKAGSCQVGHEAELKPSLRLGSKKDLHMCLALHMESSPICKEGDDFYKTGIVVCESDEVQKVVAMCCSTESSHAVQQIMLNTSITFRNCIIYLSRKPCSTCTKFLIQGEVSAVYYWPRHPERKGNIKTVKKDLHVVDDLFLRSSTISSVFVPLEHLDNDNKGTVSRLAERTKRFQCSQCKVKCEETPKEYNAINCYLLNLLDSEEICKTKIDHTLQHLNDLLNCPHWECIGEEPGVNQHQHALQLCYLLATRSDDPHRGVGCVLYDEKGFFFGAGYNGYPIGALHGNLPRTGRSMEGYPAKKPALVHAEANALLFRSKKNIENKDVLYCSQDPCGDCQKYIEFVGIKWIVAVEQSKQEFSVKKRDMENKLPLSEHIASQDGSSDQKDNKSDEPKADVEKKAARRPEKRDVCLFLAIHMENSPFCETPQGTVGPGSSTFKFCKTGIVICEGDTFQRIIAMDCSSESLHAVQKVLLKLPNELRGCNVYLSRKPCIDCVKFLVQAQVHSILFWPNSEIEISELNQKELSKFQYQRELINNILKESCTYHAMFVPLVNTETEKTGDAEISSIFDCVNSEQIKEFSEAFLKEKYQKAYKEEIEKAQKYFQMLTANNARKLWEYDFVVTKKCQETKYIQHALQLCNLLATRSDVPNKVGKQTESKKQIANKVGTVIYKEKNIVAAGYNGFPRGTMNHLFLRKDDGSLDEDRIVCAEANALIFRPEDDLTGAELITLDEPCPKCICLIKEKGLKRIIYSERPPFQPVRAGTATRERGEAAPPPSPSSTASAAGGGSRRF